MLYHMHRTWPLLLLGGFLLSGVHHVYGITIYTKKEVEAVNGTSVKLECTFSSTHPVSPDSVTVSWNFRPLKSGTEESVFYYQEVPYLPQQGIFKDKTEWSGDVMRKDVSITLHEVLPTFNGTYICQVRNRPDVHGPNGEIILKVVNQVSLSQISILVAAVAGASCVILILLGIFVAVRHFKKKHLENDTEMGTSNSEKDKSVCSPAEAAHLIYLGKTIEAVSSDEPSGGGGDDDGGCPRDDDGCPRDDDDDGCPPDDDDDDCLGDDEDDGDDD